LGALQRQGFGDDHLFRITASINGNRGPRAGGIDGGLNGRIRGGRARNMGGQQLPRFDQLNVRSAGGKMPANKTLRSIPTTHGGLLHNSRYIGQG